MPRQGKGALATALEQGGTAAEELAYRLRQQHLTAEYGRFVLRAHDSATLLQEATCVCALGLQSEFCKVLQYLPQEHQFIVCAGVGWRPGIVGQARTGADTESPAGYASRVRTIAQLHDRLWRTHEVHTVDLAEFLAELCARLGCSAGPEQTLSQDFVPVTIATDQAVPVALLVNELVTNAFKYAYPGGGGEVRVSVRPAAGGQIRMEVCDRGVGLPRDFNGGASTSLGMKLIATLGSQLGGTAEWQDAQPGTRYVLNFFPQEVPASQDC